MFRHGFGGSAGAGVCAGSLPLPGLPSVCPAAGEAMINVSKRTRNTSTMHSPCHVTERRLRPNKDVPEKGLRTGGGDVSILRDFSGSPEAFLWQGGRSLNREGLNMKGRGRMPTWMGAAGAAAFVAVAGGVTACNRPAAMTQQLDSQAKTSALHAAFARSIEEGNRGGVG